MNKISIIGAGLTGLMCAIKLAQRNYFVSVFEKRSHEEILAPGYRVLGKPGRSMSMDLSTRGINALKQVGILEAIASKSVPMINKIFHHQDGSLLIIPYGRDKSEHILTVSRSDLYQALFNKCKKHQNISINYGHILHDLEIQKQTMKFLLPSEHRAAEFDFDILIGADGVNSKLRDLISHKADLRLEKTSYHHSYKELTITKNNSIELDLNAMHIWPRSGFMLVAQPNFDRYFTCALIMKNDYSINSFNYLHNINITDFFSAYFADVLKLMPNLAKQYQQNPVGTLNVISAQNWICGDRIVLIGDAAHSMVPFFGQGVNCCFEDCSVLMSCLEQSNHNWPETLHTFNQIRVPDANAICTMSINNYPELLAETDLAQIMLEKQIEALLAKEYSDQYRTYHNLVCFDSLSYKKIEEIRALQKNIISKLSFNLKKALSTVKCTTQ